MCSFITGHTRQVVCLFLRCQDRWHSSLLFIDAFESEIDDILIPSFLFRASFGWILPKHTFLQFLFGHPVEQFIEERQVHSSLHYPEMNCHPVILQRQWIKKHPIKSRIKTYLVDFTWIISLDIILFADGLIVAFFTSWKHFSLTIQSFGSDPHSLNASLRSGFARCFNPFLYTSSQS